MRTLGGGDVGNFLDVTCVPDATFKSAIDALIAASTKVVGKLVSLTFLNNYEVAITANDAIPDGEIIAFEKHNTYGYLLAVRLFSYIDQNSVRHTPVCIKTLPYSGTIALQDSVIINGSTYMNVDDGGSGGWGAVISKDTTAGKVDVLF